MIRTALIMAGGKGERFWPKSRQSLPKQFLSLTNDGKTMIQLTVERIKYIVKPEDTFVVTNENYKYLVREQLPQIPEENIICEPVGRNTAPCIGLGAMYISNKYPGEDPTMVILPSDHLIQHDIIFRESLRHACDVAEKGDNLVTIGITPSYPETGYGYICYSDKEIDHGAFAVEAFVEKPDLQTAKKYLEEGHYLWNSGMFIFKLSTFSDSMLKYIPKTYSQLNEIKKSLGTSESKKVTAEVFPTIDSLSIDYGIMEKAGNIFIIPGNFGWDDVGSWLAVSRINRTDENNNYFKGQIVALNTSNTTIASNSDQLVAAVGLNNLIVVNTEDAILILSKDHAGEVKELLAKLRQEGMDKYL